ncbi:putative carbonic anhydrase 3 [Eurytemora carolleeae]|uniref:putative carbonic anhydrase 3 n=1 Tax=Eurytemora carolleeae TaxID=1294199 RepID=UPI000C78F6DB|nr:putative carbonic anhydrase 3 [Eurytemora carolleeae]|eukprot:XP_023321695.1 putative carbonic anhydrase 3 [Eurytemora affinis]
MAGFLVRIFLGLNLGLIVDGLESSWSYNKQAPDGPSTWPELCRTGDKQSPINLPRSGLEKVVMSPLVLENYDIAPEYMEILNTGYTATLTFKPFKESAAPRISGGGLGAKYKLSQLYFHWGATDATGSEHTRSYARFPLEMHLLHVKESSERLKDPVEDSLAVLAVQFKMQLNGNPALDRLLDALLHIQEYQHKQEILSFPLDLILPDDVSGFYRYNGSLTSPPCHQIVTWSVIQDTVDISLEQLELFRLLKMKNGESLVENYREIQNIGDRRVLHVFTVSGSSKLDLLHLTFMLVLCSTNLEK